MISSENILLLIYRISLGKLVFSCDNETYILYGSSPEIKYEAEIIFSNIVDDQKYEDWWRKDNLDFILNKLGLWSADQEKMLIKIEKNIENLKFNLYSSRFDSNKTKNIRKDLENQKKEHQKLLSLKHYLDYLTLEEFADHKKTQFIITQCLKYKDSDNRVFNNDLDNISYSKFEKITSAIGQHMISIETYKKIARHESWKMIWYANKNNIFGKAAFELTDEQKTLVSISNMYDRIYEHPECPQDFVLDDEDMLDGWMIDQKRKNETNKKESSNKDILSKHSKAKEIFILGDRENIEEINSLNSTQSKNIIKQRNRTIKNNTEGVDEIRLPDVQYELLQKLNIRK
jgi:hypothetical protein